MDISRRLETIAEMVSRNSIVCDVGTDHGYLAIYLIKQGISPKVIAMDVAKGPLSKAKANILAYGCEEFIETRLSDGVEKLAVNEAQTVIMAGMGGILINRLLENGQEVLASVDELILSPHTDVCLVRKFLHKHGYAIDDEQMVLEEGKYYVIIKAVHGNEQMYSECEYEYGKHLFKKKNPILQQYLSKELEKLLMIKKNISDVATEGAAKRKIELEEEIRLVKEGLGYYEM